MEIPSEMGCSLTPISLLQVYIGINYWKIQRIYLLQAAFVQRFYLTRLISPLNYNLKKINLYIFQLGSVSFFLWTTSIIPLQSVLILPAVRLFPWASWVPFRSSRSSHRFHLWTPLDILVRCLWPGQVGILGWGGGDSLVKGSNPHPVSKSGCPRKELLEGDWDRREILC